MSTGRYIVATRECWKQVGVTDRTPSPDLVPELLRRGSHLPFLHDELFSPAGLEVRFIPVDGGEVLSFTARYELIVEPTTPEATNAARLLDNDFDDD